MAEASFILIRQCLVSVRGLPHANQNVILEELKCDVT